LSFVGAGDGATVRQCHACIACCRVGLEPHSRCGRLQNWPAADCKSVGSWVYEGGLAEDEDEEEEGDEVERGWQRRRTKKTRRTTRRD
jgi:hypothetical protein